MIGEAPRPMPSADACRMWCQRVHEMQSSRMQPAEREALAQRVEAARRFEESSRRCNALRCHAERSPALAAEGLRQMTACSTPAMFAAVQQRWHGAQMASESAQSVQLGALGGFASGPAMVLRSTEVERAEHLAQVSALAGAGDARAVAADADLAGAGGCSSEEDLLSQLRAVPEGEAECTAKFLLYEGYATQVEKIRGSLLGFYEENRRSVPPAVAGEMGSKVRAIDSGEAMGIPDPDTVREWFVYHMMRQASRNNRAMAKVLHDFEKKMELLASLNQSECPVCLETFAEGGPRAAETLGCCHKVCGECWAHWTRVMAGSPFCPLCRSDEFLGTVAQRATPMPRAAR